MNAFSTNPRRQAAILSVIRWTALLLIAFILTVVGYLLFTRVLNRTPVDVYIVARGPAVSAVYGTVTINATISQTLVSQNSGYLHTDPKLNSITRGQGALVKNDQLMATVVDAVSQRVLNQLRADYEAAVSRQKTGPNTLGLLRSAQNTLDAFNRLPNEHAAIPKVQYDAATNEVNRLRGIVDNEKLELQHVVDATASAVKAGEDQLRRTEIRAPFDGIVTVQIYNDNAFVLPNQTLFTVNTLATYVSGQVNEEDVGQLKHGMKAEVRLYAYGNTTFNATVDAVLPNPDANSSRYFVTLALDQPPDNLMYGETGEMNIFLGRKEDALVIPARALQIDQVLLAVDGVLHKRTVKVGFKSLEFAEITEGLNVGDAVIIADDLDAFRPGMHVLPARINPDKAIGRKP